MPIVITTATCPPAVEAGNVRSKLAHNIGFQQKEKGQNMRKEITNKTSYIRIRTDGTTKKMAEQYAGKFFDGNMSAMVRYWIYHPMAPGQQAERKENPAGRKFTKLSGKAERLLANIHLDYEAQNHQLLAIGKNINQLAHHVNAQAISHPSPVTAEAVRQLADIRKDIDAIRMTNGKILARAKDMV